MTRMSDLLRFVYYLDKNIIGLEFQLILREKIIIKHCIGNAGDVYVGIFINNSFKNNLKYISCYVPSFDPSNDNRIIVQKFGKKNIDSSYYEK